MCLESSFPRHSPPSLVLGPDVEQTINIWLLFSLEGFGSRPDPECGIFFFLYCWCSKSHCYFRDVRFPSISDDKVSVCNKGDPGSIPGSGRSPGEGNGNPLRYSCLENPMDGGAWQATVHGVTRSQTWLSHFTFRVIVISMMLVKN